MEDKKQKPQKPPLSPARIAGELSAGAAVGAFVGALPILLMAYQEAKLGRKLEEWEPVPYVMALFLTYPLGTLISAICVYFVGNAGNQTGSFWSTLGYTLLGFAASVVGLIACAAWLRGRWFREFNSLFAIAFFATPTLGAVVGFNLSRRYETPPEP